MSAALSHLTPTNRRAPPHRRQRPHPLSARHVSAATLSLLSLHRDGPAGPSQARASPPLAHCGPDPAPPGSSLRCHHATTRLPRRSRPAASPPPYGSPPLAVVAGAPPDLHGSGTLAMDLVLLRPRCSFDHSLEFVSLAGPSPPAFSSLSLVLVAASAAVFARIGSGLAEFTRVRPALP